MKGVERRTQRGAVEHPAAVQRTQHGEDRCGEAPSGHAENTDARCMLRSW